jgi:hypothetical protein
MARSFRIETVGCPQGMLNLPILYTRLLPAGLLFEIPQPLSPSGSKLLIQ